MPALLKKVRLLPIIVVLHFGLVFGYSCAPNLEKMLPRAGAFAFEPTDKCINVANVFGGSTADHLLESPELEKVIAESIKSSHIFTKVLSDDTTQTCDYELVGWILTQEATAKRGFIVIKYEIEAPDEYFEKTIETSYHQSEDFWSASTQAKTLENAVRKNMEELLVELYLLAKKKRE